MWFPLGDGRQAVVQVWHDMNPQTLVVQHKGQVIETPVKAETRCLLAVDGHNYLGVAHCSLTDTFKATTGCKKALARAMAQAGLNKDERTRIWAELAPVLQ